MRKLTSDAKMNENNMLLLHCLHTGTTSLITRIVTATTSRVFHESQIPQVEVHISPATETIISPHSDTDEDDEDEGPQLNSTSQNNGCLLYTSPSPRDKRQSRMPSSA